MSAIALAFGALTLGVPHLQDTAAASLAEKKSPSPSGVKLAAPFWWSQQAEKSGQQEKYEWTNDGVSCPAHLTPPVKEKLLKLTANTTASSGDDACDPALREVAFGLIDKDDSGTVTVSEMEDYLEKGEVPKEAAVYIVAMYDENGDGKITKKEFNDAIVCVNSCNAGPTSSAEQEKYEWTNDNIGCPGGAPPASVGEYCDPAFREAVFGDKDKDDSGTVTTSEVEDIMVLTGIAKETAVDYVAMYDENGDGKITKKEFNDAVYCVMSCQ